MTAGALHPAMHTRLDCRKSRRRKKGAPFSPVKDAVGPPCEQPRSVAVPSERCLWSTRLHALDDDRNALTDADAHGAQRIAAAGAVQLVDRGREQARAAGPQRV